MNAGWEPVQAKVTVLVDNSVMELIPNSPMVQRLSEPCHSFVCEHGFSVLVESGRRRILIDTGSTGIALSHNLNVLGIDPGSIDLICLSHGHSDHTGGLSRVPGRIITHPDAFHRRYLVTPAGKRYDLTCPDREAIQERAEFHREPVPLAPGVWATGEIPRTHDWEPLRVFEIEREGKNEPDEVMDDQGIAISTREGLVVIAGCSHAGIVNTVEHAVRLSGISKVFCVLGGFHLIGPAEAKIGQTVRHMQDLGVQKVMPVHCTGFAGIKQFSEQMKGAFEYVTAGCAFQA